MKTDIVYTQNTLFINLTGVINNREINYLKKKITPIVLDYEINNIVIDIIQTKLIDEEQFYNFINDYKSKYNLHLQVKNN